MAVLGVAGCASGPLDATGQALFDAGYKSFQDGRYREADEKFSAVIKRSPTTWALSEVYYFRGLSRLKLNRRPEAKQDFRAGATVYGRELTQVYSAVALANLEYEEGNDPAAVRIYRQALDHKVKGLPADYILYRLGVSLQRLGKWGEADDCFAELVSKYPQSSLAADARRRFQTTYFTVQVGAFADRANAQKTADRLRAEGYPVTLSVSVAAGKTLHTVCAGRYATYREAALAADVLKAKGYPALVKP